MDLEFLNDIIIELKKFYFSDFMLWIKFFLGVYTIILLIDLILLLILQLPDSWIINKRGANIKIPGSKEIKKRWLKIEEYLQDQNESFWKIAILEADKLVNDVLSGFGYQGKNLGEKLANSNASQIEYYEELKKSHQVRNQIIKEKDFFLNNKEAKKIIDVYKKYLETVNLLNY